MACQIKRIVELNATDQMEDRYINQKDIIFEEVVLPIIGPSY